MNKASFIATSVISTFILGAVTINYAKPWMPNLFGYKRLGWVHTGKVSLLGDVTSARKWTGIRGFQSKLPWPLDHHKVKLKAGQRVQIELTGRAVHGKVRVGVSKRAGYYHNPMKVGQISESQYLRLTEDYKTQTLIYEIKEDGYYDISISTMGDLNRNFTIKTDILYDVKWRLI